MTMLPEHSPQPRGPARWIAIGIILGLLIGAVAWVAVRWGYGGTLVGGTPSVVAGSPEAAGRYLVVVGGCNDCHTPGFMQKGMEVPESEWLTGVPVGWRGPWGTTYASNLRLSAAMFPEETWVKVMKARTSRPPMPWTALHGMSDADFRSVYRYIRSLGSKGEKMPSALPPGEEPQTPYFLVDPQQPRGR